MMAEELERIVQESSRKLFQVSKPPIRYHLLTDIMAMSDDDALVRKTLEECKRYPPRLRLLGSMRSDGTWPISRQRRLAEERGAGPPVGWTYMTMLRNLYDLCEYRTSRDEGHVQASLEKILSWQREEGYVPGPSTELFPLPHHNGLALGALVRFGMEEDPRVQKLARWLLGMQRPDGGWLIPFLEDVRYLPEYRKMRMADFLSLIEKGSLPEYDPMAYEHVPSCVWTTLMVVRGLCQSYKLAGTDEVLRGADFVADHFFKKNNHSAFLKSASNWTRLKYPTYFGSGLCALDTLTWLGYGSDDQRMERPVRWLLGARSADGFWAQSERPRPEKDQWITEIAISILNRYSQSLRHVPFGRLAELEKSRNGQTYAKARPTFL